MTPNDADRLLVPVDDSVTLRETVAHALDQATAGEPGEASAVHFVYVAAARAPNVDELEGATAGRELLERVALWAEEDLGDGGEAVTVETALVGTDVYLFGPADYAEVIAEYARDHDLAEIILDPEYTPSGGAPLLQPLQAELQARPVPFAEAPVERPARRTGLARAGTLRKYLVVFGIALGFYLAIGEFTPFDVVTGVATAIVVSALLAPVALGTQPALGRFARQLGRLVLYIPYLLWEITKANLAIAYVVLHPSLPIDPELVSFRAAVWGDVPVTTLANSITLTPGTLTVDVAERSFLIHTLTGQSRRDLFGGGLERAVRFVYWGRRAMRIPSPRQRERVRQSDTGTDASGATEEEAA